ncbi:MULTISPECIES: hypothetical protein [unclassified Shewanella]|uniref:hypothetical protein n=1 Tax=unclassified Shewanella TaxID=196818 RepID=UPI0021D8D00C|nr:MULTISPECIES: hypothetical protein [unclassified Shewanella]MCU8004166.1 hypothetical protein [Shewanella sp. SM96]MCU8007164.1 hypothetical protein [Shewanella sp. SM87]MCU8062551.1 hypothetical protein [Shewanella sp. SM55]MCU8070303.1 hypothetical protein [Shewanella sp. SM32]MCU8089571.1 hypothetical protein [Shewanella sp. SM21]
MFMLTIKKSVQMSVLLGALVGSVAAHAEAAPISDVVGTIEQTLTVQTQELFVSVKREFVMSLQTQLAESMYDFNSQLSLNAENKGESAGADEYSAK